MEPSGLRNRSTIDEMVFRGIRVSGRWRLVRALLAVPIAGASMSSCSSSGSGGSSGGAATSVEIRGLCDAQCARRARCNPQAPTDAGAPCAASCIQDLGHLAENVRGDITRALTACYDALACGVNDDGCMAQAVVAIGQSPDAQIHSQDVQRCLQKQDECAMTQFSFSDDICGTLIMIIPSKRAELARCFDGPCELFGPCAGPIVGP
jgi:hypothetical protein